MRKVIDVLHFKLIELQQHEKQPQMQQHLEQQQQQLLQLQKGY